MRKFVFFLTVFSLFSLNIYAQSIDYGYNAHGDYVPVAINGERIDYGYNAHGDYVPVAVGNQDIDYGYNAHGEYVPIGFDEY